MVEKKKQSFLYRVFHPPRGHWTKNTSFSMNVFKNRREKFKCKCFRIPALLTIPNIENRKKAVKILAFAEGRKKSCSDFGDIALVMKSSNDMGKSWSEIKVIWDSHGKAVQNPMPILLPDGKTVLVGILFDRKEFYLLKSRDRGETWEKPRHIKITKPKNWQMFGPAPGHGVIYTKKDGSHRIIFPGMYSYPNETQYGSFILYSDDLGDTWKIGHVFDAEFNECLSAWIGNEEIITILRSNGKLDHSKRIFLSWSDDGGISFTKPIPELKLITPICQASVISHPYNPKHVIISHPNSERRRLLAYNESFDGGKTWDDPKILFQDGSSVYSDLAWLSNNKLGILAETNKKKYQNTIDFAIIEIK